MKPIITYSTTEYKSVITNYSEIAKHFPNAKQYTEEEFRKEDDHETPVAYIYEKCDELLARKSHFVTGVTPQNIITDSEDNYMLESGMTIKAIDIFKAIAYCNELNIYATIGNLDTNSSLLDLLTLTNLPEEARVILANRITKSDLSNISEIINPTINELRQALQDPLLENGAKLIQSHLSRGSNIILYTDSDGDGISCATIGTNYSELYIRKPFDVLVNKRKHGNGINDTMLMEMINRKPDLIITADHGSNDHQNITILRDNGIDVIVTDHHTLETEPNPNVHINPQSDTSTLPKHISGAFVLYLLLLKHYNMYYDEKAILLSHMADIVGLSTVSDMMNMSKPINRHITKIALDNLKFNPFVKEYLFKNEIDKMSMQTLQMAINPMLNSSNRLDSPIEGVKALVGRTPVESNRILKSFNIKRKKIQRESMEYALEHVLVSDKLAIALAPPGSEGVIGILANNIGAIYNRPCFIFADKIAVDNEDPGIKGSGRGIAINVDIAGMIKGLQLIKDGNFKPIALGGGGHKGAGGTYIKKSNLKNFVEQGSDIFSTQVDELKFHNGTDFTNPSFNKLVKIYQRQDILEPYGIGFHQPLIELTVSVTKFNYYDKSKTLMFQGTIDNTGEILELIAFFPAKTLVDAVRSGTVLVVVKLQKSLFGGGITAIVEPYLR